MIDPPPSRIYYCYGEYQPIFNKYTQVQFHEGLPKLSNKVFNGREPTLMIVDDLMSETNQLVVDIFTKLSHHRNISILYLSQNVFEKNKYVRTISLNAHYLVLFKNLTDAGQFANFARQMHPNTFKFAMEAYCGRYEGSVRYILVDLKPDQDEQCRLRTNIFSGKMQYLYVKKSGAVDKSCHTAKRHERRRTLRIA